jgi:GNAT superfamily N-acetyltransferase
MGDAEVGDGTEVLTWMWAFRTRLPRALRVQRAMAERHLAEPHFYVRTVGVRTALQGQGVGSMLMQPSLARADSAALPTYIEASSERSAALYERLGFRDPRPIVGVVRFWAKTPNREAHRGELRPMARRLPPTVRSVSRRRDGHRCSPRRLRGWQPRALARR